jgi:hypothetical protein
MHDQTAGGDGSPERAKINFKSGVCQPSNRPADENGPVSGITSPIMTVSCAFTRCDGRSMTHASTAAVCSLSIECIPY